MASAVLTPIPFAAGCRLPPSADVAARRRPPYHPRAVSPQRPGFRTRWPARSVPRGRERTGPGLPAQPHRPSASSAPGPRHRCHRCAGPATLRAKGVPRPSAWHREWSRACSPPGRKRSAARPGAGGRRPCVSCGLEWPAPDPAPWAPWAPWGRTVARPVPASPGSRGVPRLWFRWPLWPGWPRRVPGPAGRRRDAVPGQDVLPRPVLGSRPRSPGVDAEACIRPCGAGRVHRWAARRNRAPGWWARWSWARSVLRPQGLRSAGPVQGPRAVAARRPPAIRCGGR